MDEKLKAQLAQCESQASEEKVLSDYYGGWFDGECPEFPSKTGCVMYETTTPGKATGPGCCMDYRTRRTRSETHL